MLPAPTNAYTQHGSADIDEIVPSLFLSGIRPSRDLNLLKVLHITHIVSLGVQLQSSFPSDFTYHSIDIEDDEDSNIIQHFDSSYTFIDDGLSSGGKVLVHCTAGVSRSVTLLASYLMRKNSITASQALDQIKSIRKAACPNDGFLTQLTLYEQMHHTLNPSLPAYRHFLLTSMARERQSTGAIANLSLGADPLKTPIKSAQGGKVVEGDKKLVRVLKCKKCRRTLATETNIIPHTTGTGQSAFSYHKRSTTTSASLAPSLSDSSSSSSPSPDANQCTSYYLEAMEWIPGIEQGEMEGKIGCPKCDSKLGAWSWSGEF
ncbi:hypothetical protein HK097_011292 [Rhizophlyctis rosea]|uniref:protein-tyrosine-phosphatase n=1 Tax=Rhizophlyctis rosea TaxID=64517 RepID=A0AAD5WZB7_9FUNG|nr:hypothetical protein HK097_011292 [Rhizophlyctis rosea]